AGQSGGGARRLRRVHAAPRTRLPRPLPGTGRERPPGAAARVSRRPPARGRARGRCTGCRRDGPLRRRRRRYGRSDRQHARPRPSRRHRRRAACSRARGRARAPPDRGARAVRALISAYDKTGLVPFARDLASFGFELVASGGTAAELEDGGLSVIRVEDLTGYPELLEGRVKTLHPRIHAGILARRDRPEDVATLAGQGIDPFDLVCVNLYPFEVATDRPELDEGGLIEMIDIGGPALLPGAAQTFPPVTGLSPPPGSQPVRCA